MEDEQNNNATGGIIYGLCFIGAAIYFVYSASTFWMGVIGLLKAIVWPVFLTYGLFRFFFG